MLLFPLIPSPSAALQSLRMNFDQVVEDEGLVRAKPRTFAAAPTASRLRSTRSLVFARDERQL
jgi:hypothetical protein